MSPKHKKSRPLHKLVTQLTPYELFIFILSLYAVGTLIADYFFTLDGETSQILTKIDFLLCLIFFVDFLVRLAKAPSRLAYLRWGWLDLISGIPSFGVPMLRLVRLGRLYRIVEVIRTFRGAQSVKQLTETASEHRAESTFLLASLLILATILFGSIAVLHYEKDAPGAQIRDAHDAIWWSVVTITTVGYGDCVPVTRDGKIIAMIMMLVGVVMFGAYTGFITAWFITGDKQKLQTRIDELEKENQRLKKHLK